MSAMAPPAARAQNPWPGLLWYTEEQAHLFFGREAEIGEFLRFIERETLTTLFGRSGLGKTSLLRAGVFPRLRATGYFPVVLRLDYSGEKTNPPQQVIALTEAAAAAAGIEIEKPSGSPQPLTLWEYFHQVHFWGPRNDRLTPVLVFDQFEEIFTIGSRLGTDAALLEQLADLAENRIPAEVRARAEQSGGRNSVDSGPPNYKIILSLREDFVWRLDTMRPILPAIMRNRFALGPLDVERGLEIIRNAGGEWVSDDVARDIVEAVISSRQVEGLAATGEIEPAYLNVMCSELFQRMAAGGQPRITRELVTSEKGGILESLYERSLAGLAPSVRLFIENHLVTPSGFRVTLPVEEARREGISDAELDTLVDRRLLRFEDRLGTRHVELAHDLLTGVVLRSRDERQKASLRRKLLRARMRAALLGSLALVAIAAPIFYWLAWLHPTVAYYGDFLRRNGSVQPLGAPLSSDDVSHRSESYRITRRGFWGRVLSIETVNGLGQLVSSSDLEDSMFYNPTGNSGHFCCMEFSYSADGRVIHEAALDKTHRMVYALIYAPAQVSTFRNVRRASLMGGSGKQVLATFDIEYDSRGYMRQVTYISGGGTAYSYGAHAIRFQVDSSGRQIGETFWTASGTPVGGDNGFEGKAFRLDDKGREIQTTFHNRSGAPVLSPDGVPPIVRWTYDQWGNKLDESYFGADGQPAVWDKGGGFHRISYRHDEHGFVLQTQHFDAGGKLMPVAGCYRYSFERNSEGDVMADRCLDAGGAPVNRTDFGFSKRTWGYDSHGRPNLVQWFAANGSPVAAADGCFGYLMDYDADGNEITPDVCLDANGNANNLAQLMNHQHVTHEESFDFARTLDLDQRILALAPNPSDRMNLEEAALTADRFDICLDQAKAVPDTDIDADHQVIRDALKMACQVGSGDSAGARATAASLIARGAQVQPYVWTFDGTRYYLENSPRFGSDPAWDQLFESLQEGDGPNAVAALKKIQSQLSP
jgi:hypothetical protein